MPPSARPGLRRPVSSQRPALGTCPADQRSDRDPSCCKPTRRDWAGQEAVLAPDSRLPLAFCRASMRLPSSLFSFMLLLSLVPACGAAGSGDSALGSATGGAAANAGNKGWQDDI